MPTAASTPPVRPGRRQGVSPASQLDARQTVAYGALAAQRAHTGPVRGRFWSDITRREALLGSPECYLVCVAVSLVLAAVFAYLFGQWTIGLL